MNYNKKEKSKKREKYYLKILKNIFYLFIITDLSKKKINLH